MKNPDDRFADGEALLRALSEVDVAQAPGLGDVPSAPPPPSPIGSPSGDGRIERLGSLAATSDDAAQRVLDVMREDERRKLRTLVDSYRLGGFVTIVAGVGLAIFLVTLRAEEVPGLPLIGLIPVLVGGCLVIYARMLARRPD